MSYGRVVCSVCKQEVGREGKIDPNTGRKRWFHSKDGTNLCVGGDVVYGDEPEPTPMLNYCPKEPSND